MGTNMRTGEPDDFADFPPEEDFDDADSLLGRAIPSCSWPKVGTCYEGVIVDIATGEQRDPDGATRRFKSGDVRRQVILTIQTTLSDNADDDGRRRLFVKGFMVKPFREAIAKAKAPGPRPGGRVKVTYTGDGEKTNPSLSAPKQFSVTYKAPAA